jgi:hypothetical protein
VHISATSRKRRQRYSQCVILLPQFDIRRCRHIYARYWAGSVPESELQAGLSRCSSIWLSVRRFVASVTTPTEYDCRHIDSARAYRNETQVGDAIRESGLPRQDIFVSVYTTLHPGRLHYMMLGFQRPRSIRSLVVTKAALTPLMTRSRTLASVRWLSSPGYR